MTKKIAINGMGRIGRAAFKILLDQNDFELIAVNDLIPTDDLAHLLTHDSVYGRFPKKIKAGEDFIEVNDNHIRKYSEKNPESLPWEKNEIDLVFECTGMFTNRQNLEKHIHAGAKHVILSAPGKDENIHTVVYGTNTVETPEQVISCGSCDTNCISPVMEIIDRHLGIQKSILTTFHAYNAATTPVNFVPTSDGEALTTTKVLPELEGLFEEVAVRGPVPIGSIADIVFCTVKPTSIDEVNSILSEEADSERYCNVLGVSKKPLVSSDIIMDPRASIVDLNMTRVGGGDLVKIMSWYDNEWGYSNQMIRTAQQLLEIAQ